jgi:hypothetical protein
MTPLISARRAAEDFARVVDGSQTDVADRYAELTATVDLLRRQDSPVARPDFVADLRSQLMAAADTLLVPAEPELASVITIRPGRHQRRLAAAAAAFVVVGGTAGVAAAAENALPGDPLYPIKRGIESAQISLNSSDAAKGHDLISQAGTRLDEIDALMGNGDATSQITHTLASYQRTAANGADLLFVAYQRNGNVDDLASLRTALVDQSAQLTSLAAQAPPTTQPGFRSASSLLADLDQQARVLCGNCGPDTGATDFTNLSSAPALQSLLSQPAKAAAAAEAKAQTKSLADKAAEIAANTPKPDPATLDGATTRDGSGTVAGVTVPQLPTQDGSLKTTVTTVTGGVEGLLDTVGTSTGGILTPVTDTVNDTLDALTTLLLGP